MIIIKFKDLDDPEENVDIPQYIEGFFKYAKLKPTKINTKDFVQIWEKPDVELNINQGDLKSFEKVGIFTQQKCILTVFSSGYELSQRLHKHNSSEQQHIIESED